jgi:hypothetical protein
MAPWYWPSFLASKEVESIVGTVCCLSPLPEMKSTSSRAGNLWELRAVSPKRSSASCPSQRAETWQSVFHFHLQTKHATLFSFPLFPRQHLVTGRLVLGNQRDLPSVPGDGDQGSRVALPSTLYCTCVAIAAYYLVSDQSTTE